MLTKGSLHSFKAAEPLTKTRDARTAKTAFSIIG